MQDNQREVNQNGANQNGANQNRANQNEANQNEANQNEVNQNEVNQNEANQHSIKKEEKILPSEIRPVSLEELGNRLLTLWNTKALELVPYKDSMLIPYVCNDAVECYLLLEDCQVQGSPLKEMMDSVPDLSLVQEDKRFGVLMKSQEGGACFSLWFSRALLVTHLYQYHRILHNWVPGQEHLRRLVYILGTIYEKQSYLTPPEGYTYTNEVEKELSPLMEFSPFRSFRPAAPEYCGDFPDTKRGFKAALSLAKKAGDKDLLKALRAWRRIHRLPLPFLKDFAEKSLRGAIEEAEAFYTYLDDQVTKASLAYPERAYQGETRKVLEEKRRKAEEFLLGLGYEGTYPDYVKGDEMIRVYEEHPFLAPGLDDLEPGICLLSTSLSHGRPLRRVMKTEL